MAVEPGVKIYTHVSDLAPLAGGLGDGE